MTQGINGIPVSSQANMLQGVQTREGIGGSQVTQLTAEDVPLPIDHIGNRGWHGADVHNFDESEGRHVGTETVHPRAHIQMAPGIPTINFPRHQQVLVEILPLGLTGGSPAVMEKIRGNLGNR